MADEKRDPAAELQALVDATAEALRPLAEFARAAVDAFSRAAEAWLEENRPALEALSRMAQDPRLRAYAEAHRQAMFSPHRACHCLCGKAHPADKGICEAFSPVTTRRFETELLGVVDVPLCAPCAAAQFLTEMTTA